jgi:hypothetical protein
LIGFWKLDESSGTTAEDSSGQGNDGTLANGPLWQPSNGMTPGALSFDGVDRQSVNIAGSVAYATQNAPFSFSAWFNLTDWTNPVPDIMQIRTDTASPWHVLLGDQAGMFYGISLGSGDGSWVTIQTNNLPSTGVWHHVVATYNGNGAETIGNFQIFLDGVPQPLSGAAVYGIQAEQSRIGAAEDPRNQWKGLIRDVRIYNRVLGVQEILQLYSGT